MELRNVLTPAQADARYVALAWTTVNGLDDSSDTLDLGAVASYAAFIVEYLLTLPASGRSQAGLITITHHGGVAAIDDHHYSYQDPEIAGLTWSAAIAAGQVQLVSTKTAVGDSTRLQYRVTRTPA
jgi:hypothetical protein